MLGAGIHLWGKPLTVWDGPEGAREWMFWHLVTTGVRTQADADRRLDLVRCARLNLVRPMLEHLARGDMRVCSWREKKWRKKRWHWKIMVVPVDFSYVILLKERPACFVLETAYPVGLDRPPAAHGARGEVRRAKLTQLRQRPVVSHRGGGPIPACQPLAQRLPERFGESQLPSSNNRPRRRHRSGRST